MNDQTYEGKLSRKSISALIRELTRLQAEFDRLDSEGEVVTDEWIAAMTAVDEKLGAVRSALAEKVLSKGSDPIRATVDGVEWVVYYDGSTLSREEEAA